MTSQEKTDQQIVQEFQAGDRSVFDLLVKRYSSYCLFFFQHQRFLDRENSRDLAQEVLLKIFKGLDQFVWRTSLKAWILAICRNAANDFLRRRSSKIQEGPFPDPGDSLAPPRNPEVEAVPSLKEALSLLPPRQKEVIELKYFWQFRCEEIAQFLEIPLGTVKSDLSRARMRLLEIIHEEREENFRSN